MPTFVYTAANNQGEIINGELETPDKRTVSDYLSRQDLTIISIHTKKISVEGFEFDIFSSVSSQDRIMLVKHLTTIIKAGLTLKEGIEIVLYDTKKKALKKILTEAKFDLEKGQPLSVAFKKYPNVFSPIFIAFLEAGEASGTLDQSLEHLGVSLSKEYKLMQKVWGAMVYPMVLIFASAAIVAILMIFVVPNLIKVFSQSKNELPWITKLIVAISSFLTGNIYLILGILLIAGIAIFYFRSAVFFQRTIYQVIFKIPLVSALYQKIILARFARILGTLLASGATILKALDISSQAVGQNRYLDTIKNLKAEVVRGVSLGNAFKHQGEVFPYMLSSMVSVGEKTGKTDSILIDLAEFYEEEIDNSLKSLVSLIEPLLLLVMGAVVAGIAFAVILPIYQLVGSVR
ncbi:MAG: type II secretion system F family protein [bacterium]|nr:type II secretion system F family protein [bacterium]